MASKTTYTCDVCKKPVSEMFGVLRVSIRGEKEKETDADLELCGFCCLETWIDRNTWGGRE